MSRGPWWDVLADLDPSNPWLLDLYGNAAGAGAGYKAAGYDVVGVDVVRRACGYPAGPLVKADALAVLADVAFVRLFAFVHTSPPCQLFTRAKHLRDAQGKGTSILDLVDPTRRLLDVAGVPYVIENVPDAPVRPDLLLCGSMFPELAVTDDTGRRWLKRHRVFEFGAGAVVPEQPECRHREAGVRPLGVYASMADNIPSGGQTCRTLDEGRRLMAMPWASWKALTEALPPPYCELIGRAQLSAPDRELALW